MRNQTGQVILGLILVMVIALGIGLSVVQRSLVDISTSSKVEDSSRAFSAAEAGIEKALKVGTTTVDFTAENNSRAAVSDSGLLPCIPGVGACPPGQQAPLEYPPLAKEEVAHFWLASPTASLPVCTAPDVCYTPTMLDVYWGNSTLDRAALELTLVYHTGGVYQSRKWYLDQISRSNGFDTTLPTCTGGYSPAGSTSIFQCKVRIGQSPADTSLPSGLMLLRARLLYNSTSQPIAIQGVGGSIPPQAKIIKSIGSSGETQRTVQVFQIEKVVPPYFDFVIFAVGEIKK